MSSLARLISTLCVLSALTLPFSASAEIRFDGYNGGSCAAYPGFEAARNTPSALPYSFFIYGFRGSAFCHFSIPSEWKVNEVNQLAVIYNGLANSGSGPMRFRLCVYGSLSIATTCGRGENDRRQRQDDPELGGSARRHAVRCHWRLSLGALPERQRLAGRGLHSRLVAIAGDS
jgi:hypothetical protein